jgi:transcriptional regulator with XRE-family HTH domain
MDTIHSRLGSNVKRLRKNLGWTQAKLAEKIDITPTFMMHIEHGTRGASLETVELLAHALGVDIPDLFEKNLDVENYQFDNGYALQKLESNLIRHVGLAIKESINEMKPV